MTFRKIGEYTITRELGQGGMGKVCEALSPDGATVAVKTVIWPEGLDARARWETVERFQREARASRSLTHPNICRVLDTGADDDTFFIVMEFLDGQTVAELIQLAGAIKVERALEIMVSVCEALGYAHERGIVHRDIKPDNIMVLRSGQVKLTDFGLASIVHETSVTQTGTTMGTFYYMSPEQAQGEKLDARSDIFSAGSTFYEMLTGQKPFEGDAPAAVINQILSKDPPLVENVPAHIARAVSKCLRKRREHRFQNAAEILDSLRGGGRAAGARTVVMPEGAPGPVYGSTSPSMRPPAAGRKRPAAQSQESVAPGRVPDLRCSKCHEPMRSDTPSCWRCGTPNPVIAQRRDRKQHSRQIEDALRDLAPRKKRGWLRRGR